jgi:hypothetical protein
MKKTTLTLLGLTACGIAQAQDAEENTETEPEPSRFIELMGGYLSSSLDITVYEDLTPGSYLTVRGNLQSTHSKEESSEQDITLDTFLLASLSFSLGNDFYFRVETYNLSGTKRDSFGLEYNGMLGPVTLMLIPTIGLNQDVEFVTITSIAPEIKRMTYYGGLETVTNVDHKVNGVSSQKSRLGICPGSFCFGLGVNTLETWPDTSFSYNIGAFAAVEM